MLHYLLRRLGIYYSRNRYMIHGIDWLWDIRRIVKTDRLSVMFDVGANIGQTCLQMNRHFQSTAIHAFEPVASTFEKLLANTTGFPCIHSHQIALSNTTGSGRISIEENDQLSRLVCAHGLPLDESKLESVPLVTIDDFCERHGVTSIDVLKIDTEGHEMQVLQGAEQMLRRRAVAFIFAETCFNVSDKAHTYFPDLFHHLLGKGFTLNCFYDNYYLDGKIELVFCNALFVNPDAATRILA